MTASPPRQERRRRRPGTLERPVNGRMYRGTWLLLGIPFLVAAFSVTLVEPLPRPALPPTFDPASALTAARELVDRHPDRSPGSRGGEQAARWVAERFSTYGLEPRRQRFSATIPGRGRVRLENVIAVVPGRSVQEVLVVTAHRDNAGIGPGANDNASGTGALHELAREYARLPPAPGATAPAPTPTRTLVFVSTDGGAFGGLGAAHFARDPAYSERTVAAVNLDELSGRSAARLEVASDEPRAPAPRLVRTASVRVEEHAGREPRRAGFVRQLLDLAFPFTLYEQGPFLARGIPAVTLTTGADRPTDPFTDSPDGMSEAALATLGRSAQGLVASLDEGLEFDAGTTTFLSLGSQFVRGWAVQLVLVFALLPFVSVVVDLFARCRRRGIALAPAFRSYRSRLAFWLFLGAVFALLALAGVLPHGAARPLSPETAPATSWPALAVAVIVVAGAAAWLVTRERLLPRRPVAAAETLAGYTAALLALAVVALVVAATNPFALVVLLPALHLWLWLPQLQDARTPARIALLAAGFAAPVAAFVSFATRLELGFDAPWYLATLVAVGYVEPLSVIVFLASAAAAAQLVACAGDRYAPYPTAAERPPLGPLRRLVRRLAVAVRARRAGVPEVYEAEQ